MAQKSEQRIHNNCRSTVQTYGDVINCMIELDEAQ